MKKNIIKLKKPKKSNEPEKTVKPLHQEKDDQFDFGGLPKRDLKKNLGCG